MPDLRCRRRREREDLFETKIGWSWDVHKFVHVQDCLAEIFQAMVVAANEGYCCFCFCLGGRTADGELEREIRLCLWIITSFFAQPLGEDLRFHQDKIVIHQNEGLRRDG